MDTALTARVDEQVVDALIGARLIDPADRAQSLAVIGDVLGSAADESPDRGRARSLPQLVEVVAYLGGALVLAAGALFLFEQWGELGFVPQVALLAVVTLVLLAAGVVVARVAPNGPSLLDEANDVRRRLAGSLLTFGALGAAFLVGLIFDHATTSEFPEVDWTVVAAAVVGVVVGAIGYRMAPTALGLVGTIGGAVTATMTLIDGVNQYEGDAIGVALFLLGVIWLGLAEMGWFREIMVARSLGVTVALVGAQVPVIDGTHSWLGYSLTLVLVIGGISLYLAKVAWPYLAAAVIAVTLVVPEAVSDWTDGSLGAVGGVLIAGITLLLASFAGYRIRAETTD